MEFFSHCYDDFVAMFHLVTLPPHPRTLSTLHPSCLYACRVVVRVFLRGLAAGGWHDNMLYLFVICSLYQPEESTRMISTSKKQLLPNISGHTGVQDCLDMKILSKWMKCVEQERERAFGVLVFIHVFGALSTRPPSRTSQEIDKRLPGWTWSRTSLIAFLFLFIMFLRPDVPGAISYQGGLASRSTNTPSSFVRSGRV